MSTENDRDDGGVHTPRFVNQWSVGNLLTVVSMVIGMVALYNEFQTTLAMQAAYITQQKETLDEVRQTATQNETRLRALELGFGRVDEKMVNIAAQLTRIENAVKMNQLP